MTSAREDGFRLCLDGAGVVLTPRPVVRLGPVVAGRPVAEVEALLPRLFALCGQAHREAFRRALTPPRLEAILPGVVVAEGLGELAVRLLVEGAALLPAPPDIPGARHIRALVQEVLAGHTPDRATLDAAALPLLGDLSPEAFAALTEAEALAAWAQRNTVLPARLLAAALTRPALCRPAPPAAPALDDIDRTALAQRLRTDPDFPRTPAWPSPRETSALTRHAGHPLIQACRHAWSDGIATRLAARLLDVALRLPALALPQPLSPLRAEANGVGLGEVDAPRGRLMYAVEAHHGLIHSLHLLTPTDWTFHPQGILVQALTGRDDAAVLAPWWLAVLDPCVSCSLSFAVEESPHA